MAKATLHYLIETPQGEQILVGSLVGHEDCKVLEEGVTAPRIPGVERRDGRWRIIDKGATKQTMNETLTPMQLAKRLRELEARLVKAGL